MNAEGAEEQRSWAGHYIHQNPVRKGLASSPEQYPYSSANPKYKLVPIAQRLKAQALIRPLRQA